MRIFGPKRNEVIEGWRKLYNEDLHNLYVVKYSLNDQDKENRLAENVAYMEGKRNVYRVLMRKPEG
jgi:hypothetical protein